MSSSGVSSWRESSVPAGDSSRRPWKGIKKGVPENPSMASSASDGEARYNMDTIVFSGQYALKIAEKKIFYLSFVRITSGGLTEVAKAIETATNENSVGNSVWLCKMRLRVGINEEGDRRVCRLSDLRGATEVGKIDTPAKICSGNSWAAWQRINLTSLSVRKQAADTPPEKPTDNRKMETPRLRTSYREALLGESLAGSHKDRVNVVKGDGYMKLTIGEDISARQRKEMEVCVIVKTATTKSKGREETQQLFRAEWRLATLPKIVFLGTGRWLMDLRTIEEKARILALSKELIGAEMQDM